MGANESIETRTKPRGQQQVAKRGNYNPAVYQINSPQQRPFHAPINASYMGQKSPFMGKQSLGPVYSPVMLHPMPSHGTTSPISPGFLPGNNLGQLLARPVDIEQTSPRKKTGKIEKRKQTSPRKKTGKIEKRKIIKEGRAKRRKAVKNGLQARKRRMQTYSRVSHQSTSTISPAVPAATQYDSGLYNRRYPVDFQPQLYMHSSPQVYPRGYNADAVSPNTYQWRDSPNTSWYQKPGVVVTPYKQYNEDRTRGVYNSSKVVPTVPTDTAGEKRKLALKNLLIRPIVQMKGEAWDDNEWKDLGTFHSFHAACTEFLSIIELTEDKKMAAEITEFLGSEHLTPRYIAKDHPPWPGKKLNHFHVFWNLMHQLPFAVKKWNNATTRKLKLFYEEWVTTTLQCGYCKGHYKTWLKQSPPAVTDRASLNQWLFMLHNDVNKRTSKPQFDWDKYNQRWGPIDHQTPKKRMPSKSSTSEKSSSSKYSTPQKSITSRYSPPNSAQSRNSGYGSISKTTKSGGSPYKYVGSSGTQKTPRLSPSRQQERLSGKQSPFTQSSEKNKYGKSEESLASIEATVRELTGLDIDEELATLKRYRRKEQPHSVGRAPQGHETSLPRRCLSRKKLLTRRNRATKRSGPILPRKRVSRRGRTSKFSASHNNSNKQRNM